jgi:hypothetical protein
MSVVLQPIYTRTVDSSGIGSVSFTQIPQFFTDLLVVGSARSSLSSGGRIRIGINSSSSLFSSTVMTATGSSVASFREANSNNAVVSPFSMSNDTANSFTNFQTYIPGYTSNIFKTISSDAVKENNTGTITNFDGLNLGSSLFRSTAAITSIQIVGEGGNFVQNSTFTLYGIINQ